MSEEEAPKPYRTKVKIGLESVFGSGQQFVMAYMPSQDSEGYYQFDQNGNVIKLTKLGGVKVGSLGEIAGPALRAPRSFLVEYEKAHGTLGPDLIEIIPVELTEYKQLAWFPSNMIRVIG